MDKKIAPQQDEAEQHEIIPLAEEQAEVTTTRVVDRRIRIHRSTTTAEKLLETELWHEEVEIKHIEKMKRLRKVIFPGATGRRCVSCAGN